MEPVSLCCPFMFALRFICLVYPFVLSCSQWSLCLCVVHSCLPFGLFVWCFSLVCLVPNGDCVSVLSIHLCPSVYLFGVSLCAVLFPMEPVSLCCPFVFAPSVYLFGVSLCSVLYPMEPVSLCCPFMFALRFICLVFPFVLSCSQWSLCLCVVHSCLPFGLFVWCSPLFCLVPNGACVSVLSIRVCPLGLFVWCFSLFCLVPNGACVSVLSIHVCPSVYLFGVSLCSVLFPMEPVSLCCPFMFAPRFICLVFLFVLSCSQWSLCLCVVHSWLPFGLFVWYFPLFCLVPNGACVSVLSIHVCPSVYLFGVSLCSVLFPMEPVSLCCPFMFAPRFICLVFLFVLSCSQWRLCLCVVHSCLPFGLFVWCIPLFCLVPNGACVSVLSICVCPLGLFVWCFSLFCLVPNGDCVSVLSIHVCPSVYLFGISLCSVLFPMKPVSLCCPFMFALRFICLVFPFVLSCSQWSLCLCVVHSCLPPRFICLVFPFVLSCSQWSLCLCVVHSCLPFGLSVWCFPLFCLVPNGACVSVLSIHVCPSVYLFGVSLCSVLFPMEPVSLCCPFMFALRFICLVFPFVLSCSQWRLCLCVVHSCLPLGLFVWCFSLFCLVPNGDCVSVLSIRVCPLGLFVWCFSLFRLVPNGACVSVLSIHVCPLGLFVWCFSVFCLVPNGACVSELSIRVSPFGLFVGRFSLICLVPKWCLCLCLFVFVSCLCFVHVARCLSFCPFSYGHCINCPS